MLVVEFVQQRAARLCMPATFHRQRLDLVAQPLQVQRLAQLVEHRRDLLDRLADLLRDLGHVQRGAQRRQSRHAHGELFRQAEA